MGLKSVTLCVTTKDVYVNRVGKADFGEQTIPVVGCDRIEQPVGQLLVEVDQHRFNTATLGHELPLPPVSTSETCCEQGRLPVPVVPAATIRASGKEEAWTAAHHAPSLLLADQHCVSGE